MAKAPDFSAMSYDELVAEQQRIAKERAQYEQQYKEMGHTVQQEIDKRLVSERFRAQLEGLDEQTQKAVIAGIQRDMEGGR